MGQDPCNAFISLRSVCCSASVISTDHPLEGPLLVPEERKLLPRDVEQDGEQGEVEESTAAQAAIRCRPIFFTGRFGGGQVGQCGTAMLAAI